MKRHVIRLSFLLACAACLSLPPSAAAQDAQGGRVFSGKLGEKYRIQMRLRREGEKLSGAYFYERIGQDLTLRGEIDARGDFTLREYDARGKQGGVFKGQWKTNECEDCGEYLTGEWTKPDGRGALRFDLRPYAVAFRGPLKLVTRSFAEKNRRGQPEYEISVEYPQLEGSTDAPVARFNELIRDKIRKEASFREGFRAGEAGVSDGSDYDLSFGVGIATDDLISIDFVNYFHYAGAGERTAISETLNYDLRRGRVIKFDELFRPGSDYEKLVGDYCLADLKRQYKAVEGYTDESLNGHVGRVVGDEKKWAITPQGLDIIFDSEEMGPHGSGEANVYVPYSVLRRVIRPDGPLAAFVH